MLPCRHSMQLTTPEWSCERPRGGRRQMEFKEKAHETRIGRDMDVIGLTPVRLCRAGTPAGVPRASYAYQSRWRGPRA